MDLQVGKRYASANSEVEVIVVSAAPDGEHELTCAGASMVLMGVPAPAGRTPSLVSGAQIEIGKRYEHPSGIVVLCTHGGFGELFIDSTPMTQSAAKVLPSSD
jgi:hypothetical protein